MEKILGYDCDYNPIEEFRILRFPFSSYIENWEEEPNIDPRFYCAIEDTDGKYWAISVYDDYNREAIKRYENLNDIKIPTIVVPLSEREGYEVAFSGINGLEWYYDRNRQALKDNLEKLIKVKQLSKKQ